MEIVCILGSPRSTGFSSTIAKHFGDTAEKKGASVRYYYLNKLNYKGCQGCMACKTESEKCILKDDLSEVLDSVYKADILVLTTPVYMANVTGQLKCFIDRIYSFMKPDYLLNPNPSRLPAGKRMVFIMTQGAPIEGVFDNIVTKIDFVFKHIGFKDVQTIRGCGLPPMGEITVPENIMKVAEETAIKLTGDWD